MQSVSRSQFSHLRNFIKAKLYHTEESKLKVTYLRIQNLHILFILFFIKGQEWKLHFTFLPYTYCTCGLGILIDIVKQEPI